jgi:hypothetical protein
MTPLASTSKITRKGKRLLEMLETFQIEFCAEIRFSRNASTEERAPETTVYPQRGQGFFVDYFTML